MLGGTDILELDAEEVPTLDEVDGGVADDVGGGDVGGLGGRQTAVACNLFVLSQMMFGWLGGWKVGRLGGLSGECRSNPRAAA